MTHYDHATAMILKLDRWREDQPLRNYELEALACQHRAAAEKVKKQSFFWRRLSAFVAARTRRALKLHKSQFLSRHKN